MTEFRKLLRYEPKTGQFFWRISPNRRVKAGDVAGSKNRGYVLIRVSGKLILAHRLAWFFVTGRWPKRELDHRNGRRDDNRFQNLREATHAQNQQNRTATKRSKSGHVGVFWDGRREHWFAQIRADGKQHYLGSHETVEDAAAAYRAAKARLHSFNPEVRHA